MKLNKQLVQDKLGNARVGVPVTVYITGSTTRPILYAANDESGETLGNPLNTDNDGYANFYVVDGVYDIVVGTGDDAITYPQVQIYDLDAFKQQTASDAADAANVAVGTAATAAASIASTSVRQQLAGFTLAQAAEQSFDAAITAITVSGAETVGDAGAGMPLVYDEDVDAAYVTANPTTSFLDAGGRGFRQARRLAADVDAADGNTVQQNLDRGGKVTPTGTGATTRDGADVILALGLQAKSYGAVADGATDDRTPLGNLITAAAGGIALLPDTYATSAGAVNPNPAASDPDPSALYITDSYSIVDGLGKGHVVGTMGDKGLLYVVNNVEADRPVGVVTRNFHLTQPDGTPELGGLQDDYFAIRGAGAYDWLTENVHIVSCSLGYTDQFLESTAYSDYYTFDADTDVSVSDNSIIVNKNRAGTAAVHDFVTGSKVALSMSGDSSWSLTGATPPAGILAPYRFYAIKVDADTIKLAASYDDAIAGTAIDITAAGSGTITITRMARGSKRNILRNFTIDKCGYLGVQLGGCEKGSYTAISIAGQSKDGTSRGVQHGVRADGFFLALTEDNYVEARISRMANGLSLQSWSERNTFVINADDCTNGCTTPLPADYVAAPKNNTVYLTANRCNYGINDLGGSNNTYIVDITNPKTRGIYATNGGGGTGLATGNTYRGRIRRTLPGSTARLVELSSSNANIDLVLEGSGSTSGDTSYGMLVQSTGADVRGSVRVSKCQLGVQLSGTGSHLFVKADNCGTAMSIPGNNHVVFADIDGNISITGNNNTIIGRVNGTVTNTGTGNRIQVVAQAGWTAGTGTASKGAFAAYAGATMSAAYTQTEAQATNDAVKAASQRLLALEQAVRIAGLIT